MKPTRFLLMLLLIVLYGAVKGQVGINTDGSDADPAAMLDVKSSDMGILIPRIDFNKRPGGSENPTVSPVTGLLIYVTANGPDGNNAFYYFDGTVWKKLYHHLEADYVPYENATRTLDLGEQTLKAAFGTLINSGNEAQDFIIFEQSEVSGGLLNGININQIRSRNESEDLDILAISHGILLRGDAGIYPDEGKDAVIGFHIDGDDDLMAMTYFTDTLLFMMVGDNGTGNVLHKPIPNFLVLAENTDFFGGLQIVEPDTARLAVRLEDFGGDEGYMPVISGYKFVEDENRNMVEEPSPIVLSQGMLLWDEHETGIQGIIFANHEMEGKGMILHGYNDSLQTQGFFILGDIINYGNHKILSSGNQEPEINEVLNLYYYGNKNEGSGSMMRFKSRRSGFGFIGSSINTAAFAGVMTDNSEENWSGSLHGYVYNAQQPDTGIRFMEVDGSGKIFFRNFDHKIGKGTHHLLFEDYKIETGEYEDLEFPVIRGMANIWHDNGSGPQSYGTKSAGTGFRGFVFAMPDSAGFLGPSNPSYYFWDPDIGEPGAAIEWDYYEQDAGTKKMIFRSTDGFLFEGNVEIAGTLTNTHTYQVGDWAHGGIIFYLDESGKHGLVVEAYDLYADSVGLKWSGETNFSLTRAETNGIYAGYRNTERIILLQDPGYGFYAARLCSMHSGNDYGDWYLPSTHELNMIYQTLYLQNIGGFTAGKYWTSSEIDQDNAEYIDFVNGITDSAIKSSEFRVRPIRRF